MREADRLNHPGMSILGDCTFASQRCHWLAKTGLWGSQIRRIQGFLGGIFCSRFFLNLDRFCSSPIKYFWVANHPAQQPSTFLAWSWKQRRIPPLPQPWKSLRHFPMGVREYIVEPISMNERGPYSCWIKKSLNHISCWSGLLFACFQWQGFWLPQMLYAMHITVTEM